MKITEKSKNIIIDITAILVTAIIVIGMCIYCEHAKSKQFELGKKQGYSDGYKKGVSDSYKKVTTQIKTTKSTESTKKETAAEVVYITEKGTKYHKKGCAYLKTTQIEIDKYEAIGEGYTPCSRCFKDGDNQ